MASPFYSLHFHIFLQKILLKNYRNYNHGEKRKQINLIGIFIAVSLCLLFSYTSHLIIKTHQNIVVVVYFSVTLTLSSMGIRIL